MEKNNLIRNQYKSNLTNEFFNSDFNSEIGILNEKQFMKIKTDLNFPFSSKELLSVAFTRKSALKSYQSFNLCYERLELLGDSALRLAISDLIYEKFPDHKEGQITQLRNKYESNRFLAKISNKYNLPSYLHANENRVLCNDFKVQADVLEAVIGVAFVDSGKNYLLVKEFIKRIIFEGEDDLLPYNNSNFNSFDNFNLLTPIKNNKPNLTTNSSISNNKIVIQKINNLNVNVDDKNNLYNKVLDFVNEYIDNNKIIETKVNENNNEFMSFIDNFLNLYLNRENMTNFSPCFKQIKAQIKKNYIEDNIVLLCKYYYKTNKFDKCTEKIDEILTNCLFNDEIPYLIIKVKLLFRKRLFEECLKEIENILNNNINNRHSRKMDSFEILSLNILKLKLKIKLNDLDKNFNDYNQMSSNDDLLLNLFDLQDKLTEVKDILKYKIIERKINKLFLHFYVINKYNQQALTIIKDIITIDREHLFGTKYYDKDIKQFKEIIISFLKN